MGPDMRFEPIERPVRPPRRPHVSRDPAARRRLAVLAAVALLALVVGLVVGGSPGSERGPGRAGAPAAARERSAVARLPLRRQLGQLLVSSFDGPRVPAYIGRRLRAGETAGVILFGRNAGSADDLRSLTRGLQRSAGGGALVAVDQEGGQIRSVAFAGPQAGQAAQGTPAQVQRSAAASGRELRALGVNVNLAPVADVPASPSTALAGRSFSGPTAEVAARVRASVRGSRSARVAATAKHFPGLGAAAANTDDAPVTIGSPRARLDAVDLAPFRAAIAERVPLVMASHALYPAYDRERIASQSPALLSGLLRGRLHFRGAVVTDSLEAQAVLDRSSVAVAARRSIEAGADLVLMTGSASWNDVFPALLREARRSPGLRRRVERSAARVLALKRGLGLRTRR
jgi:beta-N-acetylhexosaminidase